MKAVIIGIVIFIVYKVLMSQSIKDDEKNAKGNVIRTKEKIDKIVTAVAVLMLLIVTGISSFYTISEQEAAVITTFGIPKAVTETGLHVKIPFIQKVTKVNTTINGFPVGYSITDAGEVAVESESLMITEDYNFVNVDFYVEYRTIDPIKYLYASSDPVGILKNISQSWIRDTIGAYDVDSVLTTGKGEIQAKIKEKITSELEQMDIGLQLINITIQDAEPPTAEVMEAFKAVETAKQGMETTINAANKYQNEQLPLAEAEVDRILQEAEVQKTQRINEAYEDVALFNAMFEEYIKDPETTKLRMFYESMESILPNMRIIINDSEGEIETIYPIESFLGD